jgi:6-phosphogluconate dehydrogenase
VLRKVDPDTGRALVDDIADAAGQKGTGRWTAQSAMDLGVPVPTLTAALEARELSALRAERQSASSHLPGPDLPALDAQQKAALVDDLQHALLASRICAYAQGMNVIRAASSEYGWNVNLRELARIWKGGCIIRARLLDSIMAAYEAMPDLRNLLLAPKMQVAQDPWRRVVGLAIHKGVPCPALSASLAYYDAYRSASLPQNLIQAQRDAFGAHTYERIDRPGFVHTDWE